MGAVRHLSTNVSITVKFQIVAHVSYDYVKNFHYPCMLHKLWKKTSKSRYIQIFAETSTYSGILWLWRNCGNSYDKGPERQFKGLSYIIDLLSSGLITSNSHCLNPTPSIPLLECSKKLNCWYHLFIISLPF